MDGEGELEEGEEVRLRRRRTRGDNSTLFVNLTGGEETTHLIFSRVQINKE